MEWLFLSLFPISFCRLVGSVTEMHVNNSIAYVKTRINKLANQIIQFQKTLLGQPTKK